VLVLETQRLPHCDRARGRVVDAAEDAVEELGLAPSSRLGCRSGVDDVLRPEEQTGAALESWWQRHCILISARSRLARGASRMELDRALEAEAERLLDGDMQEAELL
jgi:hypothetical protein